MDVIEFRTVMEQIGATKINVGTASRIKRESYSLNDVLIYFDIDNTGVICSFPLIVAQTVDLLAFKNHWGISFYNTAEQKQMLESGVASEVLKKQYHSVASFTKEGLIVLITELMNYLAKEKKETIQPMDSYSLIAKCNEALLKLINPYLETAEWLKTNLPDLPIRNDEGLTDQDREIRILADIFDQTTNPCLSKSHDMLPTTAYSDRVLLNLCGDSNTCRMSVFNYQNDWSTSYIRSNDRLVYGLHYPFKADDEIVSCVVRHEFSVEKKAEIIEIVYVKDNNDSGYILYNLTDDSICSGSRPSTNQDKANIIKQLLKGINYAQTITIRPMCKVKEPVFVNTIGG